MKDVDVLVVGGGMAGLAFACALGQAQPRLSLLLADVKEPAGPSRWPDSFDPRVSALSNASQMLLHNTGAWQYIKEQRFAPYQAMDVWDGNGTGNIQFSSEAIGYEQLGVIVENRVTQWGLWTAFHEQTCGEFVKGGIKNLQQENGQWLVGFDHGETCRCKLVVGADGGRSSVRTLAGFKVRSWPYDQSAIVTTVQTEQSHHNTARQVFLDTGPLAFLPLRERLEQTDSCISSIVWSVETESAQQLMQLSDAQFTDRLGAAFEHRLGTVTETDRRYSFPLVQQHAVDYVLPGLALIGDAAHTIHPLAGQGINLGFLDAAVLAEEISASVERGLPPGEWMTLRRYQRRRKPHNLMMMGAMEGFKRLFAPQGWMLHSIRNLGMNLMNQHGMIKNRLMAQAMGLEGDLPKLAQPDLLVEF